MEHESLVGLEAAFEAWRSKKRYRQEPIPAALLQEARRAARRHGATVVARVTNVDRKRLNAEGRTVRSGGPAAVDTPTFSRLEFAAPAMAAQPFAELEMATGLKVRLFAQTNEVVELLSSVLGAGGGQ